MRRTSGSPFGMSATLITLASWSRTTTVAVCSPLSSTT